MEDRAKIGEFIGDWARVLNQASETGISASDRETVYQQIKENRAVLIKLGLADQMYLDQSLEAMQSEQEFADELEGLLEDITYSIKQKLGTAVSVADLNPEMIAQFLAAAEESASAESQNRATAEFAADESESLRDSASSDAENAPQFLDELSPEEWANIDAQVSAFLDMDIDAVTAENFGDIIQHSENDTMEYESEAQAVAVPPEVLTDFNILECYLTIDELREIKTSDLDLAQIHQFVEQCDRLMSLVGRENQQMMGILSDLKNEQASAVTKLGQLTKFRFNKHAMRFSNQAVNAMCKRYPWITVMASPGDHKAIAQGLMAYKAELEQKHGGAENIQQHNEELNAVASESSPEAIEAKATLEKEEVDFSGFPNITEISAEMQELYRADLEGINAARRVIESLASQDFGESFADDLIKAYESGYLKSMIVPIAKGMEVPIAMLRMGLKSDYHQLLRDNIVQNLPDTASYIRHALENALSNRSNVFTELEPGKVSLEDVAKALTDVANMKVQAMQQPLEQLHQHIEALERALDDSHSTEKAAIDPTRSREIEAEQSTLRQQISIAKAVYDGRERVEQLGNMTKAELGDLIDKYTSEIASNMSLYEEHHYPVKNMIDYQQQMLTRCAAAYENVKDYLTEKEQALEQGVKQTRARFAKEAMQLRTSTPDPTQVATVKVLRDSVARQENEQQITRDVGNSVAQRVSTPRNE